MESNTVLRSSTSLIGIRAAQVLGITLPAFFAGTIWGYNYLLLPAILKHSPPKVLAIQWLEQYQFGARYVRPLALLATLSNAFLALGSANPAGSLHGPSQLRAYSVAALSLPVLLVYTLAYMEPGINGELKLKVTGMTNAELKGAAVVGEEEDTATAASREEAEHEDLKTLVRRWGHCNDIRMVIAFFGAFASASGAIMGTAV